MKLWILYVFAFVLYTVQIVFATLRLSEVVLWSWWIVNIPILIIFGVAIAIAIFFGLAALVLRM